MNTETVASSFWRIFAGGVLLFAAARARAADFEPADKGAYTAGAQAMNEHRWRDAVTDFDQVIDAKAKNADAAMYWKAYSLHKLGNQPLALATCLQLRSQFTKSSWNKDCGALSLDVRANTQVNLDNLTLPPVPPTPAVYVDGAWGSTAGGSSEDDLKILALNSLLHQDPARAMPLVRGILTGNQSMAVKKQAIFVLAQSKSPQAQTVLRDAVTGKMDAALQRQAIQMMAVFEGKRANDTLVEVYRSSNDAQVKRAVISAMFITQDATRMVELARAEKDLQLKRSIVSQLALMQDKAATDYMLELLK